MRREGAQARLILGNSGLDSHPHACLAQWLNIRAIIAIVRSIVGKGWSPPEITFVSRLRASEAALTEFRDTRVMVGQPCTSVLIEAEILARPCREMLPATAESMLDMPDGESDED